MGKCINNTTFYGRTRDGAPDGVPEGRPTVGGCAKGGQSLSCLNRQMRQDRCEDPTPLRNPTRHSLFQAIKAARVTCVQAVWEEIALSIESPPRHRLIRLLEIIKGEEAQALLPDKQTAYQGMLFERRRQEYDKKVEHLVFLMKKEDRIAAAYHAHFHPDAGAVHPNRTVTHC